MVDDLTIYASAKDKALGMSRWVFGRGRLGQTVDESLSEAITALSARLYSDAGKAVDLRRIRRKLKVARRRYLDRGTISGSLRLPPLNP